MKTVNKPLTSKDILTKQRKPLSFKYDVQLDLKLILTAALIATFVAVIIGFIQILAAGGIRLENPADSAWTYSRYNQMNYLTAISILGVLAAGLLTALKFLASPKLRKQITTALILLAVSVIASVGAFVLSSIAPDTDEVFSSWAQERYGAVITENPDFKLEDGQIIINKTDESKVLLHKNSDNSYSLYSAVTGAELEHR